MRVLLSIIIAAFISSTSFAANIQQKNVNYPTKCFKNIVKLQINFEFRSKDTLFSTAALKDFSDLEKVKRDNSAAFLGVNTPIPDFNLLSSPDDSEKTYTIAFNNQSNIYLDPANFVLVDAMFRIHHNIFVGEPFYIPFYSCYFTKKFSDKKNYMIAEESSGPIIVVPSTFGEDSVSACKISASEDVKKRIAVLSLCQGELQGIIEKYLKKGKNSLSDEWKGMRLIARMMEHDRLFIDPDADSDANDQKIVDIVDSWSSDVEKKFGVKVDSFDHAKVRRCEFVDSREVNTYVENGIAASQVKTVCDEIENADVWPIAEEYNALSNLIHYAHNAYIHQNNKAKFSESRYCNQMYELGEFADWTKVDLSQISLRPISFTTAYVECEYDDVSAKFHQEWEVIKNRPRVDRPQMELNADRKLLRAMKRMESMLVQSIIKGHVLYGECRNLFSCRKPIVQHATAEIAQMRTDCRSVFSQYGYGMSGASEERTCNFGL